MGHIGNRKRHAGTIIVDVIPRDFALTQLACHARTRAGDPVTPRATDRGVGYQAMAVVVNFDGHPSVPFSGPARTWAGGTIQISNVQGWQANRYVLGMGVYRPVIIGDGQRNRVGACRSVGVAGSHAAVGIPIAKVPTIGSGGSAGIGGAGGVEIAA